MGQLKLCSHLSSSLAGHSLLVLLLPLLLVLSSQTLARRVLNQKREKRGKRIQTLCALLLLLPVLLLAPWTTLLAVSVVLPPALMCTVARPFPFCWVRSATRTSATDALGSRGRLWLCLSSTARADKTVPWTRMSVVLGWPHNTGLRWCWLVPCLPPRLKLSRPLFLV